MFKREFSLGGSAVGADPDTFALILRNVFGAKVKLVTGYPGGNDINLAMERQRGRRPLRLVVDQPEEPEELAAADQPAGAVQSGEERRSAGRAGGARARGERRAAAGAAAFDRGAVCRPAVLHLAGHSRRPQGCAARGVRRDHEGPAVPGGCREARPRDQPDRRGTIDAFLADLYRTPKDVVGKAVAAIQK